MDLMRKDIGMIWIMGIQRKGIIINHYILNKNTNKGYIEMKKHHKEIIKTNISHRQKTAQIRRKLSELPQIMTIRN